MRTTRLIFLVVLLAGLTLSACGQSSSSPPVKRAHSRWTIQTSLKSGARLVGISCPSDTFCVAGDGNTVKQTNDGGKTWTVDRVAASYSVYDESCAANYVCRGIGSRGGNYIYFLSEVSGSTWVPVSGKIAEQGVVGVDAISCPSTSECVAVGAAAPGGNANHYPVWTSSNLSATGTSRVSIWKRSEISFPNLGITGGLQAVSCPSARVCYTVSDFYQDGAAFFKSSSGGASWRPVAIKHVAKLSTASLESLTFKSVSCPTSEACTLVGLTRSNDLFILQTKDGGTSWRWTVELGARGPSFNGRSPIVSCASAAVCVVVDNYTTFLTANGGEKWVNEYEPRADGLIESLSCPTSRECFATASRVVLINDAVASLGAGRILTFSEVPSP